MKTKIKAMIEKGDDGKYSVFTDHDIPGYGLGGFGDSAEKAIADFHTSYAEVCEMMAAENKPAPDLEFEFYYDVASFLDFFAKVLSKSGLEEITGINQKQLWHYSSGRRNPKPETVRKIQDGLHRFAESLKQVHFID